MGKTLRQPPKLSSALHKVAKLAPKTDFFEEIETKPSKASMRIFPKIRFLRRPWTDDWAA
jgi:hypothetical protein